MLLNHLYKNTAAIAIAAFVVLGVGVSLSNNRAVEIEANSPTPTITISAGTGATWASTAAFTVKTNNGGTANYGFISDNITFNAGNVTMMAKSSTVTSRGYFQNTSTNYIYGKISSIAVTASAGGANLVMYLATTAMTNITTPSANTVTATVVGSVYTFTPTSDYKYFFLRNNSQSATATVSQVVVTIVPILSSIGLSGPSTTTYDIGQNLSLSGLVVTGSYEDGATSVETGYSTTPATPYTFVSGDAGTKSITVSYTELGVTKTNSFNVTVRTQLETDTISATNFKNYIMGLAPGALCGTGGATERSSMISQYQALTSGAKTVFGTDPTMAAAKERYNYINTFYSLGVPAAANNIPSISNGNGSFALILLISLLGLTSIGGYFFISRKRKES